MARSAKTSMKDSPSHPRTTEHVCRSPHRLALLPEEYAASSGCDRCLSAEHELQDWGTVLGATDRLHFNEYVTRHLLLFQLFERGASHRQRLALVQEDAEFHHFGLCTLLLASTAEASSAPRLAAQLLELGAAVVQRLSTEDYPEAALEELSLRFPRTR